MQPSTIVHFCLLGIGGVGQVSGKSICDIYIYICMCAQSWHYFLAVQPSTIVHFCLGIGGGGKVSGKSICDIYIYIYVCVLSLGTVS